MIQARSRRLVRLAVLAIIGLGAVLWVTRGGLQNRLTVENRSTQALPLLRITIGGETVAFHDMPPGGEEAAAFTTRRDDRFTVEGRLADGTLVRGVFGHLANGAVGERARFIIRPGGQIEFH